MKKKLLALFLCCALSFGLVTAALITPASADSELMIYSDNVAVDAVSVPKNEKKTLAAGGLSGYYQWQIQVGGDVWANIAGATGAELEVGYALVANLLYGGAANIRCRVTGAAEEPVYSNTVTVQITDETPVSAPAQAPKAPAVISEAEPVGEPVIIPPQTVEETPAPDAAPAADAAPANYLTANVAPFTLSDPAPVNDPAPSDNGGEEPEPQISTYTILINYQFEDGKQAANPWSATVAAGSTYTQTIASPVVVGYEPDQAAVEVNASAETTYTVTYAPAEVEFTVKYFQQKLDGNGYNQVDAETKKGYTESPVGANLAKEYEGFVALLYDTTTKIAADGSTVVELYYDRLFYLMKLDLDGGYGVEPIYARYGTPIAIGNPTKPGYNFLGWDPKLPATMPAVNTSHKALWKEGTAGFNVIFWYENANDNDYSVAGTYKPTTNPAPGTVVKVDDYKNQSFTGRDDKHFTFNADKSDKEVTVAGDGSTVLNIYFTRNTYTLTFIGAGERTLTCTKTEHKHTYSERQFIVIGYLYKGGCYGASWTMSPECGLEEHTHSNNCYARVMTITAKYGADIHTNFPIKDDNNETIWWITPKGSETYGDFDGTRYLGSIDTMPGENLTFDSKGSESGAKIYYYVETLNGAAGDTSYNGKNYNEYKVIDLEYDSGTSLTYREEFHPITGFTQGDSNPYLPKDGKVKMERNNYLYYTRNSYSLRFYNYNGFVSGADKTVQFEAPLSEYNIEPEYPSTLEPNVYVFDGWYTTVGCIDGTKVDFNTMTMPASDVILYAKWTQKTHTVKVYLTKELMEAGSTKEGELLYNREGVAHGSIITGPDTTPTRDPYKFINWFYISDSGEEKAFDFQMPIDRDLNLYAKWSSNALVEYTIRYELEDGTVIAPPMNGSALVESTKTFDAKTGTDLNADYQSGYFPNVGSHSITFRIEGGNDFTFIYVPKEDVEYTVKYLEKGTKAQLAEPKTVMTKDAVVTETFKQITGYAPDAYQKQLVLAAEGNEIIFWYIKDNEHAPVQTIHWVQNIKGDGYAEYQKSTDLNGVIGNKYTETPLDLPGFRYNGTDSEPEGVLTAAGLVLNLYYDRIEYPYEFRFLEQGTDKKLADSVTGNARYQAQVTQTAKAIPGYTLVSAENQAINIAIEDGNTEVKNVKTFYYVEQTVEIKYVVSGPTGCGSLDNYQESQLKVTTGTVKGAVPTAAEGFKFVGWYTDEACTQPVIATWVLNNKITPEKTKNYGTEENPAMGYEAATYYAKFEYDLADLIISKTGCEDIDENQSFLFKVEGEGFSTTVAIKGNTSVKITGLKVGTYTVTEITNWSWRYTNKDYVKSADITPTKPDDVYTFNFANTRSITKWLGGDAYSKNIFGTLDTVSGN